MKWPLLNLMRVISDPGRKVLRTATHILNPDMHVSGRIWRRGVAASHFSWMRARRASRCGIAASESKRTSNSQHGVTYQNRVTVHSPQIKHRSCYLFHHLEYNSSLDGVVGIATRYRLDDREVGVRVPIASRILSSPRRPDRFWGPPSLLFNGYQGFFLRG
jgi:hypothetical protein